MPTVRKKYEEDDVIVNILHEICVQIINTSGFIVTIYCNNVFLQNDSDR